MTEQTYTPDQDHSMDPSLPPVPPPLQPVQATPPVPVQAPEVREKQKKTRIGVPCVTGFGFTLSLLSLFLVPFYKEAFENYLTYEGAKEFLLHYYYYATLALGGSSALFALLGLILTPFGIHFSRRQQRDGASLGVSGVLIAIVAILLIVAVTVPHVMLYGMLYPD